ncbi:hypothetical protein [Mesorhizobium huakuii]|uniref:Secreted protein n=1 Tax=Mesorhizobium huakuii TaxID=28104 RepID=A0ABZ0VYE2_9HYPH|nr:hypothetical protein [Mesorhizobium huakuii]WQC02545.1 hypothetical protein U0R22_006792 [Mesorhizobium huakuii]
MAKRIAVAGWATWLSVATTSLLVMPPFSRPAGAARLVSNFLPFGLMRSMAPLFQTLLDSGAATARLAGDRHVAGSAGKLGHRARSKVSRLVPKARQVPISASFAGARHFSAVNALPATVCQSVL